MSLPDGFCFAHEDLFLIPVEELSGQGLDPGFASRLLDRGLASPAWLERFDRAFRLYWRRAQELSRASPKDWLPPRGLDVCVALGPLSVRPFFQPLGRSSCLLEHADFEPRTSSLEFATYQFFHAERMNLLQEVVPALVHDLGYWLVRTREELADFQAGCRRARGGEASGWRALAQALEWISCCHHPRLRPAPDTAGSGAPLPGTQVLVPARFRPDLEQLVRRWSQAAAERVTGYFAARAASSGSEPGELAEWLRSERPLLLVTGKKGEILWDPREPERAERLQAELRGVTADAAHSLRADWSVVGARSRAFLDSLTSPDDLPAPDARLDQDGLAYLHRERKLVAYNVHEPGMQRLREPAPPYERWMLGARTIHEWGHLAVAAGHVPVPAADGPRFEDAQARLAELFDALVRDAPPALRAHAAAPLAALQRRSPSAGRGLVELVLDRMSDWQSNLLAQRYLFPEERETYVRNNVRPLLSALDSRHLFQALARYLFEYQYLAFSSADPRRHFLGCTWFAEQFLARGLLTEERLSELLACVAELCRCHQVDESRFAGRLPPP